MLVVLSLCQAIQAQPLAERASAVIKTNCLACHGAAKMSGLDLRSRGTMLTGGERGPALVPGNADESRLYRFAAGLDKPTMPPGKTLSAEQLAVVKEWIAAGANFTELKDDAAAVLSKLEERPVTAEEKSFWAFRPVVRSAVPKSEQTNPIDAFLLAAIRDKKLQPAPPANRRALVRRAYLDLVGLPPTVEQVEKFVNDTAPDAFAKVVEELLASPHYGERWGRHWLDLIRYADSGGFEFDRDKPNAWRFRDYVIRAFNRDKPYDRFVREQLAGDEFSETGAEGRIGVGYLRLGLENNMKTEMTRLDELDDLVSTTSNAFLGMTVGCARCHNHKFDPIPQKDYYRMQAVFYPAKPLDYRLAPADEVAAWQAEVKRVEALVEPVRADLTALEKPYRDAIIASKKAKLPDYIQLALQTPADHRTEGQRLNAIQVEKTLVADEKELKAALSASDSEARGVLRKRIQELESTKPKTPDTALSIAEESRVAPQSRFLHRGSSGQPGSVMQPGVLTAASWNEWKFPTPPDDAKTSYRRRGFAEWLTAPENPLTARVMVNRIWQNHFGEGLVRTPNNFGKTGDAPTHPELLDWLASEFVRSGWSMKAMHRLMMNSTAYQRGSDDIGTNLPIDGENRLLWRMPRRRVEAEVIRDSILSVAGNLVDGMGGPGVFPYIDPALFQASSARTWPGKPDTDPSTWRRSVYVFTKRSIPLPILDIFDKPDSVASCARRNRSTIAPQSLILMNNSFVAMEAAKFAERLREMAGDDAAAQVRAAYMIALGRAPSRQEAERAISFVQADKNGLVDFCQTMFNLNEFVYFP